MVNFKPVTRNQSKMRSFKTEYHAVINIIWEVKGESIWGSNLCKLFQFIAKKRILSNYGPLA